MSPEHEHVQAIWARAVRTFLAACLEHQSPDYAIDALGALKQNTWTKYFQNTTGIVRALEYLHLMGLSPAFEDVRHELLHFYTRCLQPGIPDSALPTSPELEDWYSRVRGKARDLLERRM